MNVRQSIGLVVAGSLATAAGAWALRRRRRGGGISLKKAVIVNRPANVLYREWRKLDILPMLVDHLERVEVLDASRSSWRLSLPGGMALEWTAVITVEREDELIGWRSEKGSDIDIAGHIRFEPAPGDRGTIVRIALQYEPPAGRLGAALAALVGESPEALVDEALRRFKQWMETGEVATARSHLRVAPVSRVAELVEEASEESFPASDPPAWTGTGL